MIVKENSKYSKKKSPHVKVEITTIVAISENVKQRIKRAPDGQRLKNFGGPGVTRLQWSGFQIRHPFNSFTAEAPIK